MRSEQRGSGNTRKEQVRTLKIKEETNLIAMKEGKQQTCYRRKNKSTPRGIITLSELLLLLPDTMAHTGKKWGNQRSSGQV